MTDSTRHGGPARHLIRDATVISMDPAVGDLARASILIDGETIAAIAPGLEADGAEMIEAGGLIALPGLIDAHRHLWQSPARHGRGRCGPGRLLRGDPRPAQAEDISSIDTAKRWGKLPA